MIYSRLKRLLRALSLGLFLFWELLDYGGSTTGKTLMLGKHLSLNLAVAQVAQAAAILAAVIKLSGRLSHLSQQAHIL